MQPTQVRRPDKLTVKLLRAPLEAIIESEFPAEMPTVRIAGEDLIQQTLDGHDVTSPQGEQLGAFEFAAELGAVMGCVTVIAGTVKAIAEVWDTLDKKRSKQRDELLREKWRKSLVGAGFKSERAAEVVQKHFSAVNDIFGDE